MCRSFLLAACSPPYRCMPRPPRRFSDTTAISPVQSSNPVEQVNPNAIRILLSPEIETTLVAQMAGSITALNASLGKAVSKGSPLVSFDCREGNAKLHMAEAELASARETLAAKKQLRQLEAAGDLEVALAAAAADRAKAAIGLSRAQLSQCYCCCPFFRSNSQGLRQTVSGSEQWYTAHRDGQRRPT